MTGAIRAFLEPRHEALAVEVSAQAAQRIAPLPEPADDGAARVQARQLLALMGELGWYGHVAIEDLRALCLIREVLGAASPLADSVFALQGLGSRPLALGGSDDLRERWLPRVESGEAMAAFAMTEPCAGSDVAGMRTRAVRHGEDWVIDGEKHLISNAGIADFYCVFAVTDPDAGTRGISCFFVEADRPGLSFDHAQIMASPHPLGALSFKGCAVPAGNLLGDEGAGFKLGMISLDRLRPTVAAAACGMARRALDEAIRYARTRRQFGKPLAELQLIQTKLARTAIDLDASRLLTYRAAWEKDQGAERITQEAAMCKAFATEAAQRAVDDAIQVIGGLGCLAEHPVDRLYRSVRALRIYEGATEVQHLIIARGLLQAGA